MKIAVTGGKGGTGKSMVATSLAVLFAKKGKTILVDADVECPNDYLILDSKLKEEEKIYQKIPKFDLDKCMKCGKCASACKKDAIVFVKGRYPAFVSDACIGCLACVSACPKNAISVSNKEIGNINIGERYGVNLISGELKLGELASGEIVTALRKFVSKFDEGFKSETMILDSAAGIGCPVIASLTGTDYIVAVTEPTPSALFDLKRVLYLAEHFGIDHGIVINKSDLAEKFLSKIEEFALEKNIPIIGRIPYRKDFVDSSLEMKPIVEFNQDYVPVFESIMRNIML